MVKPLIILGSGGHAKVVIHTLKTDPSLTIIGMVDSNPDLLGKDVFGVKVIGDENLITNYSPDEVQLVNAIGSIDIPVTRKKLFTHYKALGYTFFSVIHPTAYIAQEVSLGEGVHIMPGCIVQAGTIIGDNTILNTRVTIDHDCTIGRHVHVAPATTLCGFIQIGELTHIGAGTTIIQKRQVGEQCLVGAGSLVIHDIQSHERAFGVPAKCINRAHVSTQDA